MVETNEIKRVKSHRFNNCTVYSQGGEDYCVCMKCYGTFKYTDVFRFKPIEQPYKKTRIATCPSCGSIIKEETKYYKEKELKVIRSKKDVYKNEVNQLVEKKKTFLTYANRKPDDDIFKFKKGMYYELATQTDFKKPIPDTVLLAYFKRFITLRRFYKGLIRSSFSIYMGMYNDTSYSDEGNISKTSYYTKLQNEMIYMICKNKLLFDLWFTDYTDVIKKIKKFSKVDKQSFIAGVLALGKHIEEFEFLNYDYIFCPTPEEELFMIKNGHAFIAKHTSDKIERWLRVNDTFVDKFKLIRIGTDNKNQEKPINGGDPSYQLTSELKEQYERIITEHHRKEQEEYDRQMKEHEEREKEEYNFFNFGLGGVKNV